jgi:hypothetical protein
MTDSTLVFVGERRAGTRLVVNFGIFSGREATEAEIYRLAQTLLSRLEAVEIVAEQRYEFDGDVEATVHQVCVELPRSAEGRERELLPAIQAWAEDSIGERSRIAP